MFKSKRIGVVIPAYNEEQHVGQVVTNMPSFVDRIYLVNDASTDATAEVGQSLKNGDDRLDVINHEVNGGVGAAVTTGYKRCLDEEIDICVVMAGDDQMDPDQLINLLEPIVDGRAGYSKGNRMDCFQDMKGMPHFRRFGNWILRWMTRISSGNYRVMDPQNGYTAVSADALRRIDIDRIYPYYGYCNDLLTKFAVAHVDVLEVSMPARYQGERSKIRYSRYIYKVSGLLLRNFAWRMRMKYS